MLLIGHAPMVWDSADGIALRNRFSLRVRTVGVSRSGHWRNCTSRLGLNPLDSDAALEKLFDDGVNQRVGVADCPQRDVVYDALDDAVGNGVGE